jgi:4-amino-4-deoxy-L-arabinose transferase-like glycosyltransferase
MRKRARFFVWASLAAVGLRLAFVVWLPAVVDDSRLYANIAENWLRHGIYGVTSSGTVVPTLSRLPGYPAFLALMFALFGIENFRAVLLVQVLFDLATCFLISDLARRVFASERAARAAFLLAALCPFLASYAAAALTESLEIFFTTLALDLAIRALGIGESGSPEQHRYLVWLGCGVCVGAAILLRPDGGILLASIGGYLLWLLVRSRWRRHNVASLSSRSIVWAVVLVVAGALAPLVPWTLRNLHTLHRFEPLAPRYATDSDEPVMSGFNRWVKTWMADYVSVQEIYWPVPGQALDATRLPSRAFDSERQRVLTVQLFADYNQDHEMTAELDARFAALAAERIHAAPLRYYLWLPVVRIADMWLRPRTEMLPSDPRWWEFNDDPRWLTVSLVFGLIGLLYAGMAVAGLPRALDFLGFGLFVLFLALRSAFLGTLENPEPRYTLECYPVVILLASARFCLKHDAPQKLSQRRVTHAEAGADVLGDQFNRGPVLHRVGLRQILHGLDQQALPVYVARIGVALAALVSQPRRDCNRKNLGHEHEPNRQVGLVYRLKRDSDHIFLFFRIKDLAAW